MPRSPIQALPTFSLLDRLAAEDLASRPDETAVHKLAPESSVNDATDFYKVCIKRDLAWLFNTRSSFDGTLQFPRLAESVFAYGLPDFSALDMTSSADRGKVLRMLETGIEIFEPRLKNVEISLGPHSRPRFLHFKIAATLLMQPAPEEVHIETVLNPATAAFEVK